ncbi:MAG: DUF885 family protein, partial [Actinobacteria bacterium]|nr:DUF885 family protein [Actinomycetota bacterium]
MTGRARGRPARHNSPVTGDPPHPAGPGERTAPAAADQRAVRDAADQYVASLAGLDPLLATMLGLPEGQDRLPDLSPSGQQAKDDLARATLARLGGLTPAGADERRCGRLLAERLAAGLAVSETGEHLRDLRNIFGPVNRVRNIFLLMPAATPDDWAV